MAKRFGLEDIEGESDLAYFLLSLPLPGQHHQCFRNFLFLVLYLKHNKAKQNNEAYLLYLRSGDSRAHS